MTKKKEYKDRMVGYKNNYNQVVHTKLDSTGLNVLNIVLHKLKQQGGKGVVNISLDELLKLLQTDIHNQFNVENELLKFTRDIISLIYVYEDEYSAGSFSITSYAKYHKDKKVLVVKFNEDYNEFFRDLKRQVTYYKLLDYVLIKGKYAKRLYPHLMQFKSTGKFIVNTEQLYTYLCIPVSYIKNSLVEPKVIKPAVKSLRLMLPSLKVHKVYGKYHKIIRYEFTFKPL